MAELEATITTLSNGQANSYRDRTVGLTADEALDAASANFEERLAFPEPDQPCDPATPTESIPMATAPGQPSSPAGETKPAPAKTSREPPTPSGSGTTKKAKPKNRQIKYVRQAALDTELAELQELSQAALAGDTEALDQLRVELDNRPHVWQQLADLQRRVEIKLIELVAGNDPLQAQAFRRRCSEFRRQILDGEPASLATRMAAARAVSCWLFCQVVELRALQWPAELRNVRALEQAERRFQVAMRTFHLSRQADLQLRRLACQNDADRG